MRDLIAQRPNLTPVELGHSGSAVDPSVLGRGGSAAVEDSTQNDNDDQPVTAGDAIVADGNAAANEADGDASFVAAQSESAHVDSDFDELEGDEGASTSAPTDEVYHTEATPVRDPVGFLG